MAPLDDHEYLKTCGKLASCLSISLASARKQVELVAAKEGVRDLASRKEIVERLLNKAKSCDPGSEEAASFNFDRLLVALKEDENFMIED